MVEKATARKEGPKIYVQPDWDECLHSFNESFWISVKYQNFTLEGSVKKSEGSENLSISVNSSQGRSDCLAAKLCNRRKLEISQNGNITIIKAPITVFDHLHEGKSINCLAVTEDLGASSSSADPKGHEILLWQLSNGEVRRKLEGHAFYVEALKFFPSSIVLLSASIDIKVWSCESGTCPRTMIGHRRPVSDLAIIDRGRNILSVSDDGHAKLWSCASGKQVKNVAVGSGVTCVDVVEIENSDLLRAVQQCDLTFSFEISDEEVGTRNKLIALGCNDGVVRVFSLFSGKEYQRSKIERPGNKVCVNCLKFLKDHSVVYGCDDGSIKILKLLPSPVPKEPETSNLCSPGSTVLDKQTGSLLNSPGAPILDIKIVNDERTLTNRQMSFVYSTQDGRVTKVNLGCEESNVIEEFTGVDCDPVYQICLNSSRVYSAARDGKIRVYEIN